VFECGRGLRRGRGGDLFSRVDFPDPDGPTIATMGCAVAAAAVVGLPSGADTGHAMTTPTTLTFSLHGDADAIMVNALTEHARLLDAQALEQEAEGNAAYAASLRRVAAQAHELAEKAAEQLG